MSAASGPQATTRPEPAWGVLDALADFPAPLVPSNVEGMAPLIVHERVLADALSAAPGHRNALWASALKRSYREANLAFQHRNGHATSEGRVLARALLTPGIAFGPDPRTAWVMAAHYGALVVAMERKSGRREAGVIGSRRAARAGSVAYAPLHALPWEGQEREDFLAGLPHLDAGWEFVRLRDVGGRPARLDREDLQIYAAVLASDLARQLCAASPALPRRIRW